MQARLKGVWKEVYPGVLEGCPHRQGVKDSVDICTLSESV